MTATDPSGLATTTTYYFKVNGVEYSILTGGTAPSFQDVADLIDTAISSAGFECKIVGDAPNQDIRITNIGVRGWGSYVELAYGTSGPNLWINLTGFTDFDPPVREGAGSFGVVYDTIVASMTTSGAADTSVDVIAEVGGIVFAGGSVDLDDIDITATVAGGTVTMSGAGFYEFGYGWVGSGSMTLSGAAEYDYTHAFVYAPTGATAITMSGSADYSVGDELITNFYGDEYYGDTHYSEGE
jgi:hypothetical protein